MSTLEGTGGKILVILFDERVTYVKKIKNHWLSPYHIFLVIKCFCITPGLDNS